MRGRGLGQVFHAPTDVIMTDTDVVQPDLVFVSREREAIVTPANIRGAPDLSVEILSPSTASLDRTTKRDLYARHGVKEYWIVDPPVQTVAVMLLREGRIRGGGRVRTGRHPHVAHTPRPHRQTWTRYISMRTPRPS